MRTPDKEQVQNTHPIFYHNLCNGQKEFGDILMAPPAFHGLVALGETSMNLTSDMIDRSSGEYRELCEILQSNETLLAVGSINTCAQNTFKMLNTLRLLGQWRPGLPLPLAWCSLALHMHEIVKPEFQCMAHFPRIAAILCWFYDVCTKLPPNGLIAIMTIYSFVMLVGSGCPQSLTWAARFVGTLSDRVGGICPDSNHPTKRKPALMHRASNLRDIFLNVPAFIAKFRVPAGCWTERAEEASYAGWKEIVAALRSNRVILPVAQYMATGGLSVLALFTWVAGACRQACAAALPAKGVTTDQRH